MKTNLKTWISGTLRIVSSGYDDRYVLSMSHLIIECDNIRYRIDNDNDRFLAYAKLAGWDMANLTHEQISHASHETHFCEFRLSAGYERPGIGSGSIITTASRLNAGIEIARENKTVNAQALAEKSKIAATLNSSEWAVIETALTETNRIHSISGKPIVNFSIPIQVTA